MLMFSGLVSPTRNLQTGVFKETFCGVHSAEEKLGTSRYSEKVCEGSSKYFAMMVPFDGSSGSASAAVYSNKCKRYFVRVYALAGQRGTRKKSVAYSCAAIRHCATDQCVNHFLRSL